MEQRRSAQVKVRLIPRSWHGNTSSCGRVEVAFTLGLKLPRESGNPISQHLPILKPENSRRLIEFNKAPRTYKKKRVFIFASQATRSRELLLHSIGRLHEKIDTLEAIKLIPGI